MPSRRCQDSQLAGNLSVACFRWPTLQAAVFCMLLGYTVLEDKFRCLRLGWPHGTGPSGRKSYLYPAGSICGAYTITGPPCAALCWEVSRRDSAGGCLLSQRVPSSWGSPSTALPQLCQLGKVELLWWDVMSEHRLSPPPPPGR